jgi:hypothetical protein
VAPHARLLSARAGHIHQRKRHRFKMLSFREVTELRTMRGPAP